jgi:hypothetical protein
MAMLETSANANKVKSISIVALRWHSNGTLKADAGQVIRFL